MKQTSHTAGKAQTDKSMFSFELEQPREENRNISSNKLQSDGRSPIRIPTGSPLGKLDRTQLNTSNSPRKRTT